jgi:hypothetical protein
VGVASAKIIRTHTEAIRYLQRRARGEKTAIEYSLKIAAIVDQQKEKLVSCQTVLAGAALLELTLTGSSTYPDPEQLGPLLIESYEAMNG